MKTDIEEYLASYYYAKKSLRKLAVELLAVKDLYEDAANTLRGTDFTEIKVKTNNISDPVIKAAELRFKIWESELRDIERKVEMDMQTISNIDSLIMAAGLDGREREYIEIRYFERGNVRGSAEYTQKKMNYEHSRADDIKNLALGKRKVIWREA